MLGAFVDLATALGQKVGQYITKQGVQTPTQRAVSTSGDSFDLWAGFKKLVSPAPAATTPKAGVQLLEGAQGIGDSIFNSLGRNVSSYIDRLFGNANEIPSATARQETNVVRSEDAFGGQYLDLGKAFQLFSQIQQGNPGLNTPAQQIPQQNNNVLIIGGFVALAAVLLLTQRKAA